jgi:hypothetical protein
VAEKLGIFSQWLGGEWADRRAINRNADALDSVEANVSELRSTIAHQSEEIMRLRAMIMGVVEVLHAKAPFADAELEAAVKAAWTELTKPPPAPPTQTDPYRSLPGEPTSDDIAAAKALMTIAENHHFAKRFADARATYQEVVTRYGNTKQAVVAKQQIANLRGA